MYYDLEKSEFWNNSDDNSILTYSFSIDNISKELTGNCNFSNHNNLKINVSLKNPNNNDPKNFKYDLFLYRTYYNVITYSNGSAAVKYGN